MADRNSEHVYAAAEISSLSPWYKAENAVVNGSPNPLGGNVPVIRSKVSAMQLFVVFSFMDANIVQ